MRLVCLLLLLPGLTLMAGAAEPPGPIKVDRAIGKQPSYRTTPRYCLLLFGPEGKSRVWLVLDGDTLYVDKNGNGDLTEPGEAVKSADAPDRDDFVVCRAKTRLVAIGGD